MSNEFNTTSVRLPKQLLDVVKLMASVDGSSVTAFIEASVSERVENIRQEPDYASRVQEFLNAQQTALVG